MRPVDLSQIRTIELQDRDNKVSLAQLGRPPRPRPLFADFLRWLPPVLAAKDFLEVVAAVVGARHQRRPVIAALGGHVIKCGLGPCLVDLMKRRILTAVAFNGSAAIHDVELALFGHTSEDVAAGLQAGTFGMARETGEFFNRAVNQVLDQSERGMGELLGEHLAQADAPYREHSILAAGHALQVPVTVHVAIGTDVTHMHPSANGAALGQASFNDFRLFSAAISELSGGVFLNIGSAVLLPEVFLKAFTIAQNLGADLKDFVTVDLDMIRHYRPSMNVVQRPGALGKAGYSLIGHHEILVPLLCQAVVTQLEDENCPPHADAPISSGLTKIRDREAVLQLRRRYRVQGKQTVWTNGCFDMLHAGHVRSLQVARELGDVLFVGVNSDESVRRLKGPGRPIIPAPHRAEMLAALACVDHVLVFDEPTPEAILSQLQPDVHCKGADYAPPHGKEVPEADVVASYGGRIAYLPLVPSLSTSSLVRRIREQPVDNP